MSVSVNKNIKVSQCVAQSPINHQITIVIICVVFFYPFGNLNCIDSSCCVVYFIEIMDCEEMWKKFLCWECLIGLELICDSEWQCPKCKDIYYLCYACDQKGEKSWDWSDNDKGMKCSLCMNHYCMFCWENSVGHVTGNEYDEDEYICEKCNRSQVVHKM